MALSDHPRIAVVGTGANGAAIGADLTRAGLRRDLRRAVARTRRGDAGQRHSGRDARRRADDAGARHPPLRGGRRCASRSTWCSSLVKAYDTRWACELIKPLVAPDGLVIGLQNGMTLDDMADVIGPGAHPGSRHRGVARQHVRPRVSSNRQSPPSRLLVRRRRGIDRRRTRGREEVAAILRSRAGSVEVVRRHPLVEVDEAGRQRGRAGSLGDPGPAAGRGRSPAGDAGVHAARRPRGACRRRWSTGNRVRPILGLGTPT